MIRRLTDPKWIPQLIALGRGFHAESAYSRLPYDESTCRSALKGALAQPHMSLWANVEGNAVTGFLIGLISDYVFTRATYATDLVFVAKRGGPAIFRRFEKWAKDCGCESIQVGISSGIGDPAKLGKYYERLGYHRVGGLYMRTGI